MKRPRRTARERLLCSIDASLRSRCVVERGGVLCSSCSAAMATVRRLLRAHEHELAERGAAGGPLARKFHDLGSGRGLYGAEMLDSYRARVRVQDSSSAMEPHCWVFVEGGSVASERDNKPNVGSIHLTQNQAAMLAGALLHFAEHGHCRPILGRSAATRGKGGER